MPTVPEKASFLSSLIRTSAVAMVLRLCGMLLTYLFNFVLARRFGASAVGAFALATTVVMVLSMLARLGFDRAIVRFVASALARGMPGVASRTFRNLLVLVSSSGALLSAGLYFGSDLLAVVVFQKPHMAQAFKLASPAVLLFGMSLLCAEALRGLKRIWQFALLRHVAVYLFALLALLALGRGAEGGQLAIIAFSAGCLLATLLGLAMTRRYFPSATAEQPVLLGALLTVSLPMLFSNSMGMVISWSDVLMLGRYVSEAEVGVYSIALKLAFGVSIVLNAVNSFSTPKFAEIHAAGQPRQLEAIMHQTTKLLFYTTVPLLAVLALAGKPLLGLFGEGFELGYPAMLVLLGGQFISAVSGPIANLMQMSGLERQFLAIVTVLAAVNVAANLVLIPLYGILGAAISSAVTLAMNNIACIVVVRIRHGFWSIYVPGSPGRGANALTQL